MQFFHKSMAKIEEEIKSDKFRNMYHKASLNILVTANWLTSHHNEIFKKYNLTGQQYNVLRILRGQYPSPCTAMAIRERMLDKMSDVSRIVERLRIAGYLDRISCPNDRRAVDIKITEKGLSILNEIGNEEAAMDAVVNTLSEAEAKQLSDLLEKVRS